jgi:hypothetical protein
MTDDQKVLASELDRLASEHTRLAANAAGLAKRVRRLGRVGDALDDLRDGAFLTVGQAAIICGVSDQTIYDWIADAARLGRPIAEKRATWVIGTDRLLAYVEKWRGGPAAREAAEARLKQHWPQWSQAPELRADTKKRAAG